MEGQAQIISLTVNSNWLIWKVKMEGLLFYKYVYASIKGDKAKPTCTSNANWKKFDYYKSIGYIR